jgi:hypothetical protein
MHKIIGILGLGGDGGTFLDWSLYYLSNQKYSYCINFDYYRHRTDVRNTEIILHKMQVVNNPIMSSLKTGRHLGTAHRHIKTHPTQDTIDICVNGYKKIDDPDIKLLSFYCVQNDSTSWLPHAQFVNKFLTRTSDVKCIVYYTDDQSIIDLAYRKLKVHAHYVKEIKENNNVISKEIVERSISSVRNNFQGISTLTTDNNIFMLNVSDMYYSLDKKIIEIFQWMGLEIHPSRFEEWKRIYQEWQDMLPKRI